MTRQLFTLCLAAVLLGALALLFVGERELGDAVPAEAAAVAEETERQAVALEAIGENGGNAGEAGLGIVPEARIEVGESDGEGFGSGTVRRVNARLVDEDGAPIAGGVLGAIPFPDDERRMLDAFRAVAGGDRGALKRLETRTRPDGRASLRLSDETNDFVLYGRADGRELGIVVLNPLPEDEHDVGDLVLRPGVSARVVLRDPEGGGVANAPVLMIGSLDNGDDRRLPFRLDLTGADGTIGFDHLPEAEYQVMIDPSGYVRVQIEGHDFAAEPELAVDLERGHSVRGKVVWDDGAAAEGIRVELVHEGAGFLGDLGVLAAREPWAITDAAGEFHGFGAGEGERYKLRAIPEKGEAVETSRFQGTAELPPMRLVLPRNHAVHGRLVLADGSPAAGARLVWQADGENGLAGDESDRPLIANENGAFTTWLPGAKYRTLAWHEQAEHVFETPFEVTGETDLGDLRLPRGGTLEVEVVSVVDGSPVENARVQRTLAQPDAQMMFGNGDSARQQARERSRRVELIADSRRDEIEHLGPGRMKIGGLPEGTHLFHVFASGHVRTTFEATVAAGSLRDARVLMAPAAELHVTVLAYDGEQLGRRVQLQLEPATPMPGQGGRSTTRTDREGKTRFRGLQTGAYVLSLQPENRGDAIELARLELPPGTSERTVRMPATHALQVAVLRGGGSPAAGIDVHLRAASRSGDGRLRTRGRTDRKKTGADGLVRFDDLLPGLYQVEVQPSGTIARRQLVELRADHREEVLLGGLAIAGRVLGPLEGVRVVLETRGSREGDRNTPGTRRGTTRPDEFGAFRFEELDAGDYRIFAEGGGNLPLHHTDVALERRSVEDLELETYAEAKLRVRVTGVPEGKRIRVLLVVYDGERTVGQARSVSRAGAFDLHGLDAGSFRLAIIARGGAEITSYPVTVSTETQTVVDWDAAAYVDG